jgi:ABC-2 type transport system ATP-binding protein
VDRLDFEVARGEVYGFLGRNGAGTTTTIRMLLGLVRPTSGGVRVLGEQLWPGGRPALRRVGFLVETASAYPNLTVRENLDLQRRLTGCPAGAVAEALQLLDMEEQAGRRAGVLSLGNKQRLSLARALLHRPEVLVLDEPANALDPAGMVEVRALLRRLAETRGVTIFISSHLLSEVTQIADRVGIIHRGRLLEELSRERLRASARAYLDVAVSRPEQALALLAQAGFLHAEGHDGRLRLFGAAERAAEVARVLVGGGLELTELTPGGEDLEEYFLRVTAEGGA